MLSELLAVIAKNASARKEPRCISFTLKKDGNFAPHIFISPSAKIGILTFAIELDNSKDIDNLKLLNYYLQKRDEIEKYQCVCLKPDNQDDLGTTEDVHNTASNIPDLWKKNKWGKKECSQFTTRSNVDFVCWDINDFVDCILATMGKPQVGKPRLKYFSQDRIHTFTFCSIDDPQNQIDEKTITPELLRLSRSVVDSYLLPFELMVQQGAVLKTFENIFFSSATEGTAMLCIAKPENKDFIDNLHNTFNRQYLIIYILVLLQRYTLLSLEKRLTEYESTAKDSDDELWKLIELICRIKTNCYYTDVSIYTHHSQFYQHCCKNMHIQETFEEIDNKIELLKLTTDRKIQEALEKQRKLQEEEAKKNQEEIERIRKKEAEDDRRRKEEQEAEEARQKQLASQLKQEQDEAERRQHILNGIVGVLTIAQVMQATYELMKPNKDPLSIWTSIGLGILCFIILIALMWKDIVKFIKK